MISTLWLKSILRPFLLSCLTTLFHIRAQDFETKKAAGAATLGPFDQRPYFRLLLSLLEDMNRPDRLLDNTNLQVLIKGERKGALNLPAAAAPLDRWERYMNR